VASLCEVITSATVVTAFEVVKYLQYTSDIKRTRKERQKENVAEGVKGQKEEKRNKTKQRNKGESKRPYKTEI
jgi:hypothetical protein